MTGLEFELPDVGEGVAEGELLEWDVTAGDSVAEGDVLAQVETDKAVVDVPAPTDGTVVDRRADPGDVVPVGDVLVVIDVAEDGSETGGGGEPAADDRTGRVFAPPSVRRLARERDVDLAAVEGSGPAGRPTEEDVRRAAGGATGRSGTDGATARDSASDTGEGGAVDETLAMPAARVRARELGVDIDDVPTSSSVDGAPFVTEADVDAYARGGTEQAAEPDAATAGANSGQPGVGERVPYRGVRRTIGERMKQAKFTAPHATHHEAVDVSELVAVRSELADVAEQRGFRLTYTPFFLKAVVAGLGEHPLLNSRLDEEAGEIVCYDSYNVGVAVDTEHGLMVPVVDDVDEKSVETLARELSDLVERARNRSVEPAEMQGGTFTISNAGNLGGEFAMPIVNYPEAAILGFAAVRKRPWVVESEGGDSESATGGDASGDEVVARHVLPLSLSFDHRVVDGATAARFVNDVKDYLREPRRLLLE